MNEQDKKVWNAILMLFANQIREFQKTIDKDNLHAIAKEMADFIQLDLSTINDDLGLEKTVETLEGLIKKRFVRICTDENKQNVWLEVIDPFTGNYRRCKMARMPK